MYSSQIAIDKLYWLESTNPIPEPLFVFAVANCSALQKVMTKSKGTQSLTDWLKIWRAQ